MRMRSGRGRGWRLAAVLTVSLGLPPATAIAAGTAGALDSGFGSGGVVVTNDGSGWPAAALQSSGKIVVGGTEQVPTSDGGSGTGWLVQRLDTDGSLDTGFGSSGEVRLFGPTAELRATDSLRALAVDGSDRILAVGSGSFEVTTGKGKRQTTSLVRRFTVVRLTSGGALDSSFGNGGVVVIDLSDVTGGSGRGESVHVLPSGDILVAGRAFDVAGQSSGGGKGKKGGGSSTSSDAIALVKLTASGALDTSFGAGGITIHDASTGDDEPWPGALGVQSTGRIVVGSVARDIDEQWVLTAYDSDGTVDETFGRVVVAHAYLRGFAIDASDRILGCGYAVASAGDYGFVLTRFTSDGATDTGFGSGGTVSLALSENSEGGPVLIESDGDIVAGLNIIGTNGEWRAQPIRVDSDGVLDSGFGTGGFGDVLEGSGEFYGLFAPGLIDPNGDIVLCGARQDSTSADWLVARYCGS